VVGDDSVREATGARTVTPALPLFPPLDAEILALPAATAVTTPALDTAATPVLSETQLTVRPVNRLPLPSRSVAVAWVLCPTLSVPVAIATVTVATGTWETVISEVPVLPSLVAVIVVVPIVAPAVTNPVADTVATFSLLDDHVTVRVRTT